LNYLIVYRKMICLQSETR